MSNNLHCPYILVGFFWNFDRFHRRFWSHILALLCLPHHSPFLYVPQSVSKRFNPVRNHFSNSNISIELNSRFISNEQHPEWSFVNVKWPFIIIDWSRIIDSLPLYHIVFIVDKISYTYTQTLHGSACLMLKCHFSHFEWIFV